MKIKLFILIFALLFVSCRPDDMTPVHVICWTNNTKILDETLYTNNSGYFNESGDRVRWSASAVCIYKIPTNEQ